MVYPYPPLPKSIILIILGLILIGGGGVPIFIPGLVVLNKNIKNVDNNIDDLTVNDITSAINFLTVNIGDFCGPIIGGFLSTQFGFKLCCLIISIIVISYCFIYFYKFILDEINEKGNKKFLSSEIKSEENELINHPGVYKENNLNDNLLIKEKSEENEGLKEEDDINKLDYKSLEDKNN